MYPLTMKDRTTIQLSESLRKELRILAAKRDISYQRLLEDMVTTFKEIDKEKMIISIPSKLYEKIKKQLPVTDFMSVSEYIVYVLRQMLSETEENKKIKKEDEVRTKERLRRLGYIN